MELIYDLCKFTVDYVEEKRFSKFYEFDEELYWEVPQGKLYRAYKNIAYKEKALRDCLDKNLKDKASLFMNMVKVELPKDLYSRVEECSKPIQYDFYKEWDI